jgi:hypothetical protein
MPIFLVKVGAFLAPFAKWIVAALAVLALAAGLFFAGKYTGKLECKNENIAAVVVAQEKGAKNTEAANVKQASAVTVYVDRVKIIRDTKYVTIKGVDKYVETDTGMLSPGFRVLHDAAAQGVAPDDSRIGDAEGTTPKDVATTFAENYSIYHETVEALNLCQSTVRLLKEYNDAQHDN